MNIEEKKKAALTGGAEALWKLIRDRHPDVLLDATLNKNLSEDMAVIIAKNTSSPPEALGFLAGDVRFKDSYKLKLAICRNPRTPQRVTFSLLKFLRIFDISDLTRDQHIPVNVRQKIEQVISEKIASLPSGVKTTLAKKASSTIVVELMQRGDERVISACLDSPVLTEGLIWSVVNRKATKPPVIRLIAEHPKWSLRYAVRFALIRNFNTPMVRVVRFIAGMKTLDLRELYADPKLPTATRPFIFRELRERGETPEIGECETYELNEEDLER
ncbi:MAG TPA: hypothetical protein VN328_03060 [Thermodesulfovibrionales bacterium]|nr:hypothetical protein [Thermodesulfovibrionales bacterium]